MSDYTPSEHAERIMNWAAERKLDEHWRAVALALPEDWSADELAWALAAALAQGDKP